MADAGVRLQIRDLSVSPEAVEYITACERAINDALTSTYREAWDLAQAETAQAAADLLLFGDAARFEAETAVIQERFAQRIAAT